MSNYRLKIQYDGTKYRGWQRQRGNSDTVQGKIEQVLGRLYGKELEIAGAGRTDAGVHAYCQIANFHLETKDTPDKIRDSLNEYLPQDIRILEVEQAGERFHSRLNATGKVYEYHLVKKDYYDVFARKYSWQMEKELDLEKMRKAAELLLGQHDFKGFCTRASKKKSTIRRLDAVKVWETKKDIFLRFEGSGFLYHMVRILTGTLVEIGAGERQIESIRQVLETGDRTLAGETAPAQGLTLISVKYE